MAATNNKAFQKLSAAADKGDANAQYELGLAYMRGEKIEQDEKKGFEYLEKAALQRHPTASFELGKAYKEGKGVGKDLTKAMASFMLAASLEHTTAYREIFWLMADKNYKNASAKEAGLWLQAAAEAGDVECQYILSRSYIQDWYGLQGDFDLAAAWCRKAAHSGHLDAMIDTARNYETGFGVRRNPERALYWRQAAAKAGDLASHYLVGKILWFGEGVQQDKALAMANMLDAAKKGYTKAQNAYAWMCLESEDKKQQAKAKPYLEKAVEQGSDEALLNLADMHYSGKGVKQDVDAAYDYFVRASESKDDGVRYTAKVFMAFIDFDRSVHKETGFDVFRYWEQNGLSKQPEENPPFVPDVNQLLLKQKSKFIANARLGGNPDAMHTLAMLYEAGILGFDRNLYRAGFWYSKAAEKGVLDAYRGAGDYYAEEEYGVTRDLPKALLLYADAVAAGDTGANLRLGTLFLLGRGKSLPRNPRYAYALYDAVANGEKGHPAAKKCINVMLKESSKKERQQFLKKKKVPIDEIVRQTKGLAIRIAVKEGTSF